MLYDGGENALWVFLLVTVPWAARQPTCRAGPSPRPGGRSGSVPLYMLALAAAVRFFHYALFEEPLLSLPSYLVDFAVGFCRGRARLSLCPRPADGHAVRLALRRSGPLGWRRLQ